MRALSLPRLRYPHALLQASDVTEHTRPQGGSKRWSAESIRLRNPGGGWNGGHSLEAGKRRMTRKGIPGAPERLVGTRRSGRSGRFAHRRSGRRPCGDVEPTALRGDILGRMTAPLMIVRETASHNSAPARPWEGHRKVDKAARIGALPMGGVPRRDPKHERGQMCD